jgi:hypothetical protein
MYLADKLETGTVRLEHEQIRKLAPMETFECLLFGMESLQVVVAETRIELSFSLLGEDRIGTLTLELESKLKG